jgi:hypothetical protein
LDLADQLAVPLDEPEGRHILGDLDGWVCSQHVLQELDPGLADASLAIGHADDMLAGDARQSPKHGLGIGQWNAADEMNDGLLAAICAHESLHSRQGGQAMLEQFPL